MAPPRTNQQRLAALQKANRVRVYRAGVKVQLARGELTILDLRDDPQMQTARVVEFLLATPRLGKVKAHRLVQAVGMSPSKTFGGITDRQWAQLCAVFATSPATRKAAA